MEIRNATDSSEATLSYPAEASVVTPAYTLQTITVPDFFAVLCEFACAGSTTKADSHRASSFDHSHI
jgi:hypothetical protein